VIEVEALTFQYSGSAPVFQGFSWKVARGEAWAVLGPSGCGKTTLLYVLAGLRPPATGQVRIDGEKLKRPRPRTGLILQDHGLLPWATLRENAALGLRVRQFYGPDGKHAPQPGDRWDMDHALAEVEHWLRRLGLSAVAGRYPGQVSGGQRQRAAIARTLVLQPDLLLMDEPFAALDAPTREDLQELTLELRAEQNLTLVAVTHSIEEAAVLGQRILVLGPPPNRAPAVMKNPGAGQGNYRGSEAYREICAVLRARLEPA
jgi:NitT/TauT family transport system ATP-binding protein